MTSRRHTVPRALPWALLSRPCGARTGLFVRALILNVLLIHCVVLGVSARADSMPSYSVVDLGPATGFSTGTDASGAGYVTDSTGTARYPFNHTSVDYPTSATPDATLSALPAFPAGSQVYPIAQNSQGLLLGYFSLAPAHQELPGIFDSRTSSFVATNLLAGGVGQSSTVILSYFTDMNSSGWAVGAHYDQDYQVVNGQVYPGRSQSGTYSMLYDGFIHDPLTSKNVTLDSLLVPSSSSWHISTAQKIDDQGRILATGYQGGLYQIHQPTHDLLLIPDQAVTVPEPSTLAIFGLGAVAWAARAGRRRRRGPVR